MLRFLVLPQLCRKPCKAQSELKVVTFDEQWRCARAGKDGVQPSNTHGDVPLQRCCQRIRSVKRQQVEDYDFSTDPDWSRLHRTEGAVPAGLPPKSLNCVEVQLPALSRWPLRRLLSPRGPDLCKAANSWVCRKTAGLRNLWKDVHYVADVFASLASLVDGQWGQTHALLVLS